MVCVCVCVCVFCSINTSAALSFLRTDVFTSARVGVAHIAVLVTHINSLDTAATQREADLTRRAGISIMAVGVGNWLDMSELRAAVSYPADTNTLHVDSYETLGTAVHAIRDAVCGSACTVCVFWPTLIVYSVYMARCTTFKFGRNITYDNFSQLWYRLLRLEHIYLRDISFYFTVKFVFYICSVSLERFPRACVTAIFTS